MIPQPSADTYFIIKENDTVLEEDSRLKKIRLFYYDKNGQQVSNPGYDDTSFVYLAQSYYKGSEEFSNTGIMFLRYLPVISVNDGIHDYYLQFPNGDMDTITLTSERVSCEQGWKERCQCLFPVRILKYNGQLVQEDTGYHLSNNQPVYIFNK